MRDFIYYADKDRIEAGFKPLVISEGDSMKLFWFTTVAAVLIALGLVFAGELLAAETKPSAAWAEKQKIANEFAKSIKAQQERQKTCSLASEEAGKC